MVLTCHVDSGANEGEWRWMRQNRYTASCRLCKKKKEVTLVFMRPYISFVSVRPSLPPLPLQQRDISFDVYYIQLRAGRSGFNSRQWVVYFSRIQNVQTDSESHTPPPPPFLGSGACFPKDKRAEGIAANPHHSSASV